MDCIACLGTGYENEIVCSLCNGQKSISHAQNTRFLLERAMKQTQNEKEYELIEELLKANDENEMKLDILRERSRQFIEKAKAAKDRPVIQFTPDKIDRNDPAVKRLLRLFD